ncbi:hypothetical protein FRC19_007503 [Serendipita sp. 401]|nr:hypothetical protein FRC16_008080 [Serendipita sp. 398]KAG8821637.1 hypothetical protein FRC19_007503 [Serendipita sp. 401]
MHHHYGTPGYHYYRRGPSRLWWFFLGGAAVAFWQYKSQQRWNEGERRGWFCGGSSRRREIQDERPTTNSWNATPLPPPTREELEAQKREPEPLWRLRGEKEAERRRQEQEAEFRDDLDRAREKVITPLSLFRCSMVANEFCVFLLGTLRH